MPGRPTPAVSCRDCSTVSSRQRRRRATWSRSTSTDTTRLAGTTLDVAARAAPYAAEAAARSTPGGSAWGYQVHMFLVPAGDIGGALSNAASWALISAVYNHSQYTYDAVSVIRRARDLATQLDLEASLCYASGYAPFHN